MNLFQKQPKTSGYQSIPHGNAAADDDEDTTAAVPVFGATILPRRMAIVGGTMLLLVAGGAVWMPDHGRTTTTANAAGLVVATEPNNCVPATGTFGGVSTTDTGGKSAPFHTCFRLEEYQTFCWTQSYEGIECGDDCSYYPCAPDGWNDDVTDGWHPVKNDDLQYNNPVTHPYFCGGPCEKVQDYTGLG